MMTSAPTYQAAGFTALSDGCGGEDNSSSTSVAGTDTSLSLRLVKRPLAVHSLADSCKKRRKQSTPIRISTSGGATSDDNNGDGLPSLCEGKLGGSFLSSPEQSPISTPVPSTPSLAADTHLLPSDDHLLSRVKIEHNPDLPERGDNDTTPTGIMDADTDSPVNLSGGPNFSPWLSDMSTKTEDWHSAASLQSVGFGAAAASVYLPGMPHYTQTDVGVVGQSRNANQPPIRIFNPEAYCELCNKEFCNKYFLKTHKANKHRIYSDPPVSEVSGVPVNVPTFKKNIVSPGPDIMPPKNIDPSKSTTYFNAFCDICAKGFCNKMFLRTHRASVHGIVIEPDQTSDIAEPEHVTVPHEEESQSELNQQEINTTEENLLTPKDNSTLKNGHVSRVDIPTVKEESVPEQDETSVNSQRDNNADLSANRLRRLGIMNPEAFCEICCKEYCNKYFLRTHKMKRHGILITDENSKDNQKDFKLELSITNSWYQIQTSPLNLIMGEQNTNSSGSYSERKSSPANENDCEVCGMKFQTAYLAQLHAAAGQCRNNKENSGSANVTEPVIKIEDCSAVTNNNDKHAASSVDTISEDLQKLQTMILQLNDLDVSRVSANCSLCSKEFENRYYLHVHMMTEHGMLLEENLDEKHNEPEQTPTISDLASCKLCGRDGLTLEALRQHVVECHGGSITPALPNPPSQPAPDTKDDSNGFISPDKTPNRSVPQMSLGPERRASMTLTPTSSYCEICNKELCNKYFMKTHMQRMHGIEIENGAQIGGVVCNICNKELCSKYFLRVHKHNTHGIVEDGAAGGTGIGTGVGTSHPRQSNEMESSTPQQQQQQPGGEQPGAPPTDPALKPADLSDLSHRYFTHFTEVCTICSRRFRSTKWLKAHLLGDHGKAGADKWNELELQLQQSFGQQSRKPSTGQERTSPTLRIPNGGQDASGGSKPGVHNVLSSLFGADDTNVKQYHCSFCSFSTPVLAFLFVHERSHARPPSGGDAEGAPLQCGVCTQSFRQPDQLHHHIMSQHPFLSLGPFFGSVPQPAQFTPPTSDVKNETKPDTAAPEPVDQTIDHRCTKCTQCGRSRKQARSGPMVPADVSSTLKDVSKQRQLPATYALPQRQQQQTKYMMQAFLMDEPIPNSSTTISGRNAVTPSSLSPSASGCSTSGGEQQLQQQQNRNGSNSGGGTNASGVSSDRRFVPSIVFLPVLERLTTPLTVSFTLTPA